MTKKWSKFLAAALVVVSTSTMLTVSFDAEARRMGGGSSFGRQSSNVTQKRAVTPPQQQPIRHNALQRLAVQRQQRVQRRKKAVFPVFWVRLRA